MAQQRQYRSSTARCKKAFTYIELLITLAIIAVLFIPIMQLFSHTLHASNTTQNLITAVNLAKWEMEKIRNLNVTKAQLKQLGDAMHPPLDQSPMEMNNEKWRIKKEIMEGTEPLEIQVKVFQSRDMAKPLVTLVTLIEDMTWEKVEPI